jgi:hypothetical protein
LNSYEQIAKQEELHGNYKISYDFREKALKLVEDHDFSSKIVRTFQKGLEEFKEVSKYMKSL